MNWGKGLAMALAAFAGLMVFFIVMAARNPEPLVTEQYYEEELKYQERIDNSERANALTRAVRIEVNGQGVRLSFPEEMHDRAIHGELTLLRPNDPIADRHVTITPDGSGVFETVDLGLLSGRYNALLEWSVDGVAYYTEEKLMVP
ncbi:MAG: FixH family protein [Flavobacteriales bacterium]|nr:FixH family protein [Flavobacteriales bacterium]